MNIFERAARAKLRFDSDVGYLTTEQLFELSLTAKAGKLSLDVVARRVNQELKALGEESFVETTTNPAKVAAELKMEIVKHIIADKKAAADQAAKAAETRAYKERLLEIKESKKIDALKNLTEAEIDAELAKLGA